jgi:hypothetical protein
MASMTRAKTALWIGLCAILLLVVLFGFIGVYLGSMGMDIHLTRSGKLILDVVLLAIVAGGIAFFVKRRRI